MVQTTRRKLMALAITAIALGSTAACKRTGTTLSYEGATTHIPVLSEAAAAFEAAHADVRIDIAGGGSSIGVRSVASGKADLGGVARDLTPEEAKAVLVIPFARDALAVVVGEDVAIDGITLGELHDLYAASSPPDGMSRISKAWAHGTAQAFAKGVALAQTDVMSEAVAGSNGEVLAMIAALPASIGYVSASDAMAAIESGAPIRILPVEGVYPTLSTLADGSYPLARTLWLTLPKPAPGRTRPASADFVAFLMGPEVGAMLSARGFLPVP
ncbi:substrate-binding domain-containing protein [Puniceibacterium sediminis]|uniref:Phosphate ABC transporter substrate-binding protein, PhoT family n=1 Tax=Puniceibacterium sediminis TaxID=1608407 RepID=A0A238ZY12_9RHOB|nr:substrate-binding domain-containing protein [Puniceibacterium sediminis]SNR88022.1 phosphate ABC transporter substrate-binding protein, PhoT family [Puniceibacterium sediminis]